MRVCCCCCGSCVTVWGEVRRERERENNAFLFAV